MKWSSLLHSVIRSNKSMSPYPTYSPICGIVCPHRKKPLSSAHQSSPRHFLFLQMPLTGRSMSAGGSTEPSSLPSDRFDELAPDDSLNGSC